MDGDNDKLVFVGVVVCCFCGLAGLIAFLSMFFGHVYPGITAKTKYQGGVLCNITDYVPPTDHAVCSCYNSFGACGAGCQYTTYTALLDVLVTDGLETWRGAAEKRPNYQFSSAQDARVWQLEYEIGQSYPCRYKKGDKGEVIVGGEKLGKTATGWLVASIVVGVGLFLLGLAILVVCSLPYLCEGKSGL